MANWKRIEKISAEVKSEMGGDALEICSGNCPDFAKKMVDRLSSEGIEAVIVDNLKGNAMKDEIVNYKTIESEHDTGISHCYVKVEGWFFDAFDVEGCEKEEEMTYHTECY